MLIEIFTWIIIIFGLCYFIIIIKSVWEAYKKGRRDEYINSIEKKIKKLDLFYRSKNAGVLTDYENQELEDLERSIKNAMIANEFLHDRCYEEYLRIINQ